MASAFEVAERLQKANYHVTGFTEGYHLENGVVQVTDEVKVHVSYLDRSFNVVFCNPDTGSFQFFPGRHDFKMLLADLSVALNS